LVSITAYGQQGPYSGRPAHDLNVQALSGALALGRGPGPGDGSGEAGPATPYLQVGDLSAGLQAVVATLAALRVRDATGAGQHCDVAMLDGVASLLTLAAGAAGVSGEAPSPVEHLTGALACYGTYRCADGRYLAVGALEPKFFARICALIGREDLIDLQYVPDRQGEVRAALAAVFLGDTREGWTRLLAAEDTCVTPVLDVSEFFADEQARARGLVEDVALADGSTFTRVGAVPRLPGSPAAAGPQAPGLGADLEAVAERVGLGAAEVRRLRDAGAV
jgi:crotonobetainyl-CoA:carnitine CoA-transferase CaiB-like acyl-CoA transferase